MYILHSGTVPLVTFAVPPAYAFAAFAAAGHGAAAAAPPPLSSAAVLRRRLRAAGRAG